MKNVLVIGFSTRNIVCSGARAGYNMYSIDAFCDYDLLKCSAGARKLAIGDTFDARDIDLQELMDMIKSFNVELDAIIPGSGFETVDLGILPYRVLGNEPEILRQVSDKYAFSIMMKKMGFPHPKTLLLSNMDAMDNLDYPLIIKPVCSGGGLFNMLVRDVDGIDTLHKKLRNPEIPSGKDRMIVQEYIEGVPVSVSVISTKTKAIAVAVNEQLIGIEWLTEMPFAYCGNITPYDTPFASQMKRMAEELILELGLVGSNGVDFIISEKGPVIIEVNARFQGSLDSVEVAMGINLFHEHVKAFEGEIRDIEYRNMNCAGRGILYADKKMVVTEHVRNAILEKNVSDIPNEGHVINPNEPVVSVISSGMNREDVLSALKESVIFIRESLNLIES